MRDRIMAHGLAAVAALAVTAAGAAAQDTVPKAEAGQVGGTGAGATGETRYRLVQVGGKNLPVEVEGKWRCREEVTAGTLTLRADGSWRLETLKQETCGDRTEQDRDDDDGTYRTEGDAIRFYDDDGRVISADWELERELDLDDLRTGTRASDGTLNVQLADEKTRLVFWPEGR